MPPATRAKRAATPAAEDAELAPPRKTRAKAKVNADTSNGNGNGQVDTPEPEDQDTNAATAKQPRRTSARTKVKSDAADDQTRDSNEPDTKKPAPKKGGGKVKAEPADDDELDGAEPDDKKPASKKRNAKGKAAAEPTETKQSDTDETEEKPAAKTEVKEAQVAKAGSSQIPLDEGCYMPGYHVYVDPNDGLIYDASLNQTNASGNNNKFYRIQVWLFNQPPMVLRSLTNETSSSRMAPSTRHGRVGAELEKAGRTLSSEVAA